MTFDSVDLCTERFKLLKNIRKEKDMHIGENDVIKLDFIIEKIIESDQPLRSQVFKESGYLDIEDEKLRELEFTRLINIISYNGVGITASSKYLDDSIQRNENTVKFKERGGFAKLFQDELKKLEKENERDKLEIELAKSNLEANALNKAIADKNDKNERKNTIGMWVNISVGVLNIILIAVQIWLSSRKP
ncbi:MAG TPA: hypothetical protein VIK55_15230 [Paludibacter sp.]